MRVETTAINKGASQIDLGQIMEEKPSHKWVPVITEYCIGCAKCVKACPHECIKPIWDFATFVKPDACTSCGDCIPVCEDDAIHMAWVDMEGNVETGQWTSNPPKPIRKGVLNTLIGLFGEKSMLPEYSSNPEETSDSD